ncbi:HAD family hydrolase [Rhodobacteraceae bacterium RKSG542]|uniref:HAD hydrolase-like protein n=1 Tax=Pseudovibrio flavus TaxID=2529854 RepID=UPI0012BCE044|nr:HAD hydrolase-like protein [Pseudovibrio flavus]MTI16415.1 HAD family hydrolase [Pseudovibrio flavus]
MKTLLFDLDGTLTDPFVGITTSIQYALEKLGAPVPSNEELGFCIGPPLTEGFSQILGTKDQEVLDKAVALYRERYSTIGLFENHVYDNIPKVLDRFRGRGHRLFVCTSKPHVFANRILEHFELDCFFEKVYGPEFDGTFGNKADLLRHILETEKLTNTNCVMIGDRKHDLLAASANGVTGLAVSWGYGSVEELTEFGAAAIVNDPLELEAAISSL